MRLPRPVPAVTAACLFILLVSGIRAAAIPAPAAAVLLALAAVSAWRPDHALLLVAAVLPVSSWVGQMWATGFTWPDGLVVAFGAGYFAHVAVRERRGPDVALVTAVLGLAAIVVASMAVQLAVVDQRLGTRAFRAELWRTVAGDFFVPHRIVPAVSASVLVLGGLLLLHAAAESARSLPAFAARAGRAIVAGATAAAGVTLWRIVGAALRSSTPLQAFAQYLVTLRLNEAYADVNAAGSFFVMALAVALALSLGRRLTAWTAASVVVATGLWLSGSRAALIAGGLAAWLPLAGPLWRRIRSGGALRVGLVAAALVSVTIGILFLPARATQQSPSIALRVRTELAWTGVRMFASHPVFGIGIGEFYQRSGEFSSPELIAIFPPARNENAHNYLVQVVAELGLVGFGALVWMLAIAARNTRSTLESAGADRLAWGMATGLLAFLLTCLAGHPLLVPEVAGPFWILLGAAAGSGPAVLERGRTPRVYTRVLTAVIATLIVTLPLRARWQIADTNLEHVGIDLSAWRWSEDGVRYREAGVQCTLFVPAQAGWVTLPLRAATSGALLQVEVRLDGRLANVVNVASDSWYNLVLVVPEDRDGPRFKRVDLRALSPPAAPVVLLVGKALAGR